MRNIQAISVYTVKPHCSQAYKLNVVKFSSLHLDFSSPNQMSLPIVTRKFELNKRSTY